MYRSTIWPALLKNPSFILLHQLRLYELFMTEIVTSYKAI